LGDSELESMFNRDRVPYKYDPMQYKPIPVWRRSITDKNGDGIEDIKKMTY